MLPDKADFVAAVGIQGAFAQRDRGPACRPSPARLWDDPVRPARSATWTFRSRSRQQHPAFHRC
ncbi:MAG: hypothetical protein M0C28_19425 [Candidatus Moduliflexus flocculans]|nr:hypothetical protein [Candidatus Moduliflexus flocculans]